MNGCAWLRRAGILALAALAVLVPAVGGSGLSVRAEGAHATVRRADGSAAAAVAAFYTALAAQQYPAAYTLLSPAFQAGQPYTNWLAGYATMTTVEADVTQLAAPNSVAVYLTALDEDGDAQTVVTRYSGAWALVPDGAGGWLLDSATIGVAAEPAAYATPASDFTAFAGVWWHHDFGLTLDAAGDMQASWRVGWCSEDPTPPCDEMFGNEIIDGGRGEIAFAATSGSSAVGTVVSSTDPTTLAPGATVSLTLLPFDMAVLVQNGSDLVLCGLQRPSGAPPAVFRACGA